MALNTKKLKKIRRFGKLRFPEDPRYDEKVLIRIYELADEKKKRQLDEEMTSYFQAVDSGRLKPGESILKLAFHGSNAEANI